MEDMKEPQEGLRVVRKPSEPPGEILPGTQGQVLWVRPDSFKVKWEIPSPWPTQVYTRDLWGDLVVPVEEEK
jgi:hypothetical protein